MIRKILISFIVVLAGLLLYFIYAEMNYFRSVMNLGNVNVKMGQQERILLIKSTYNKDSIVNRIIKDSTFKQNDSIINFIHQSDNYLIPGKYIFERGLSSKDIIEKLKKGQQEVITFQINRIRFVDQLAQMCSNVLEFDSTELMTSYYNYDFLKENGLDSVTALHLLHGLTLKLSYATPAKDLLNQLEIEHQRLWNTERLKKLKSIRLTKNEAMVLASIVQEETAKVEEAPMIAGVYMNRLHQKIKLMADPTVKYGLLIQNRDSIIKRIYHKDLKIDNPYNTYKNEGLPPSAIVTPEVWAIDAVLNYNKHPYIYFVANSDFSGTHHFSSDYKEHTKFAHLYREALNQKGIK